jgi:predicted sugar kinase
MLIRCYPRIHISLIDLGNATFRQYGGAGFTLSGLPTEIEALPSDKMRFYGLDKLDSLGQDDILAALERLVKIVPSAKAQVTIRQVPPQHIGLGGIRLRRDT